MALPVWLIPFYCIYVERVPAFGTGWDFSYFSLHRFALRWLAMYTFSSSSSSLLHDLLLLLDIFLNPRLPRTQNTPNTNL
jgi:hypothetical protein